MKIKHIFAAILLLIACNVSAAPRADDIIAIENPAPPIDLEVINRLWHYIKDVTKAPANLPPPPVVMDWEVPGIAAMGTQYPTETEPDFRFQISIAPRTVDMWPPEMVQYGIGHELVHYVFIVRENNWDTTKRVFKGERKHHCDPEFKTITKGVADLLWSIWHDDVLRARMYNKEATSCSNFPLQ